MLFICQRGHTLSIVPFLQGSVQPEWSVRTMEHILYYNFLAPNARYIKMYPTNGMPKNSFELSLKSLA
jgi:hypothetical protein